MKPTIGCIVIVRDNREPGREYAGIVSRLHGDYENAPINAHVCYDGGMSVVKGISHASIEGASVTYDLP